MNFDYYRTVAKELIEGAKDEISLYEDIDDAYNNDWELPASVATLDGMRKFTSTDAHDAMSAAIKTLASSNVELDVIAPHPGAENAKIAEQFETVLQHQFYLANKRSVEDPFSQMVTSAVKYGKIALQVEHVGHKFPEDNPRTKYIKKMGDYALIVHNAASVFPKYSSYTLEGVLLAQKMSLKNVLELYGKKAEKLRTEKTGEDRAEDEYETEICVYDWTDYEKRLIWAEDSNNLDGGSSESVILLDEENKLPFLNWVVRKAADPIMKATVEANTIENFNILLSLRYYTVAALAAWPRMWSRTPTGEGVDVDWTNIGGQIQMRVGEEAGMNQPPPVDEGLNRVLDDTQIKLHQATQISRALTSLETFASGTPFSTINAMREAGIASLGEVVRILKYALEDVFCHMLYWSQYANIPMRGRRRVTDDQLDSTMMMGAQVVMDVTQYDLSDLELEVSLNPDTMTDKQGRRNLAIMDMERLHLGHNHAWEVAGVKNGKQSFDDWKQEQIELANLEAEKRRIIGAVDMELQSAVQAQQQNAQAQQQARQPQFEAAQGRQPGNPSAPLAPQATREQVSGQDRTGAEVV